MSNVTVLQPTPGGPLIKAWIDGVPVEEGVWHQVRNLASVPGVERIALMPDCHVGNGGVSVGLALLTRDIIIPAVIGPDCHCGMIAAPLNIRLSDLPKERKQLRLDIERLVPAGFTNHGQKGDRGAWDNPPSIVLDSWSHIVDGYMSMIDKYPELSHPFVINQLGTLGMGNHFLNVCINVNDGDNPELWVVVHSGSRGIGGRIGKYFTDRAKTAMKQWHIKLSEPELAFLPRGTELFSDYLRYVNWAGQYAKASRMIMFQHTMDVISEAIGNTISYDTGRYVHIDHNYTALEKHFGKPGLVTRKGAVDAHAGVMGIVPQAMGAISRTYITRGLGNPESLMTSSHGAGRVMSRNVAKRTITMEQHLAAMGNTEARLDQSILDESAAAYKDIKCVMNAQRDLTESVVELQEVLCVKG